MTATIQALVGDLRTGKITTRLPLTGGAWQKILNGAGTITGATVNTAAASAANQDLYHATATAKSFLCIQYNSVLLAGGPIWTRHYNRASATLTLGATGLWAIFDHRMVIPVLAEPLAVGAAQAASTAYPTGSNLSYGDIAAALVAQAIAHVGGNLPLILPAAQGLTPGMTRTYNGFDLSVVGAMLTELTGVSGGPEIRFIPQFKPGAPTSIQWVMQVGTPAAPQLVQGGADWFFDASVPESMVVDIDYDEDATAMGTRAWEVGSGSQAGALMSQADSTALTSVGYPLLEVVDRTHNAVTTQTTLDAYAAAYLTQNNRPATVWKIKVRNDGAPASGASYGGPRVDEYVEGDFCQVIIGNDPFLAPNPGTHITGDVFPSTFLSIWPGGVAPNPWPAIPHRARILQIDGDVMPGVESVITLATTQAEV